MLFSSLTFIYWFLPLALAFYLISPRPARNGVLLAVSLFFYGWGAPVYLLLMVASIAEGYVFGLLIGRTRGTPASKLWLGLSVATSVGLLGYFKYADFFISSLNGLFGLGLPLLRVALPIGISFYTFQIMSYTIDVYRGDAEPQRDPVVLGAYVSMFPQLIAGPIVRYRDVEQQLRHRELSLSGAALGARRFMLGLCKKVLLANSLGELCSAFLAAGDSSVLFCWLYALGFTMQIYFDFSGYSDMAIGLGRIMGFSFLENFDHPFESSSVTEFWRRWHMSLGFWFRDYVYIPLGGNRVSRARWVLNILAVWLLTGLWHGAAWNFVAWGLLFGLLLMAEKLFLLRALKKLPALGHIYLLLAVVASFVLFNASSLAQAGEQLRGMFGLGGLPLVSAQALYCLRSFGPTLLISAVGCTSLPLKLARALSSRPAARRVMLALEPPLLAGLLLLATGYLVDGSFNPFLYFRF